MNVFVLGFASILAAVAFSLLVVALFRWTTYSDAVDYATAAFWVWVASITAALVGLII